jgi:hypothetical protein
MNDIATETTAHYYFLIFSTNNTHMITVASSEVEEHKRNFV